uniref:Transposase n=3 Tax=Candidatus Kentrum sp. LFY TaxID=2126342 RepID=A0A450WTE7_9GAMM|nr:MAG: Transposase [Candidatus Kentron sp. LFY]
MFHRTIAIIFPARQAANKENPVNSLETELLTAAREDRLLGHVYEQRLADRDERDQLSEELPRLHNEGKIDIVSAFGKLKNDNHSPDFILTRDILEKILPRIEAPMPEVMECVLHLFHEAGKVLAAGSILTPYTDFCAANADRPKDAIGLIDASGDKLAGLLTPSLVAGSRMDAEYYLNEAIRLSAHRDAVIKKEALFSLGRLEYPEEGGLPEKALATLEQAIGEENDSLMANVIDSAFGLYKKRKSMENRVTGLIDTALAKGGDFALYAASQILFRGGKEIPGPLLDKLLLHLRRVNPSHKGILMYIDYGLEKLLAGENQEQAIGFIEDLLTANAEIEPMKKVARMSRNHRYLLLNWFLAEKRFSSGIVEDFNNKVKLTTRKAYGFRTYHGVEIALYHALGNLPVPKSTHEFF